MCVLLDETGRTTKVVSLLFFNQIIQKYFPIYYFEICTCDCIEKCTVAINIYIYMFLFFKNNNFR